MVLVSICSQGCRSRQAASCVHQSSITVLKRLCVGICMEDRENRIGQDTIGEACVISIFSRLIMV